MSQVLQQPSKSADVDWWKTSRSLPEIAEHLERAMKEKHDLERRFVELLNENHKLGDRCARADAELTAERVRRSDEVTRLQAQVNGRGEGRQQAELAAREKLVRDEFERKIQELQLELKKERHLTAKRLEKMKADLAGCICRGNSTHTYDDDNLMSAGKGVRITYR